MKIGERKGLARVVIDPGEYYSSREPVIISTLLGSCVSVCLYEPLSKVVGMNHFLLADSHFTVSKPVLNSEGGRYGIHAMELLINDMLRLGAKRNHLQAKVFGGGNILRIYQTGRTAIGDVGATNARFVHEFLHTEKIPIQAADLGGDYGRRIYFRSTDYAVFMRKVLQEKRMEVAHKERSYWQQRLARQSDKTETMHIW